MHANVSLAESTDALYGMLTCTVYTVGLHFLPVWFPPTISSRLQILWHCSGRLEEVVLAAVVCCSLRMVRQFGTTASCYKVWFATLFCCSHKTLCQLNVLCVHVASSTAGNGMLMRRAGWGVLWYGLSNSHSEHTLEVYRVNFQHGQACFS